MGKVFTTATQAALDAGEFGVVDLLRFDFHALGALEITNAGYDIGPITMPYDASRTFTGNGTLEAMVTDEQELEFNKSDIKIAINGASSAFLSAIQSNDHIDSRVRIFKLFYTDEETMTSAGEVEQYYDGRIVGGNYNITATGSAVNLACSHVLYNFESSRNYVTSTDSLKLYNRKITAYGLPSADIKVPARLTPPRWGVK